MKTTTRRSARKIVKFAPAAWQWDPSSVTAERVQWWSEGGAMSIMSLSEARKLVSRGAAFVGSTQHVCQIHDRIDFANAPVAA